MSTEKNKGLDKSKKDNSQTLLELEVALRKFREASRKLKNELSN